MFEVQHTSTDKEGPWSGVLAAVAFAVQATVHWTLQALPVQLLFGCDVMLNIGHMANWQCVKQCKDKCTLKSNTAENAEHMPHTCTPVGTW